MKNPVKSSGSHLCYRDSYGIILHCNGNSAKFFYYNTDNSETTTGIALWLLNATNFQLSRKIIRVESTIGNYKHNHYWQNDWFNVLPNDLALR